jgi:MSHA biogenesis protein MshM
MALAEELGITFARNIGQHRLLKLITDKLVELNASGKKVALFLDEAQTLPDDCLETIRLLTNLETEKQKLLQVILFGQPELNQRLQQDSLRQLRQRVTFAYDLQPIDRANLKQYLHHRLLTAGYSGKPLFNNDAIDLLFRSSRGIPRLINILSHKAMMVAYGRGEKDVDRRHIKLASEDTEDVRTPSTGPFSTPFGIITIFACTFAVAFALYHLWMGTL